MKRYIYRNIQTCTQCGICSDVCPQGIDVASAKTISLVECENCRLCVNACPEPDTLLEKRGVPWIKQRWIILLLLLTVFSGLLIFLFSPKEWIIEEMWNTHYAKETLQTVTLEHVQILYSNNTARGIIRRLRREPAIHGVVLNVTDKSLVAYVDPFATNAAELTRKALFKPFVINLRRDSLLDTYSYEVTLRYFYDRYDANVLVQQLSSELDVVSLSADWRESDPFIRITLGESVDPNLIRELIEKRSSRHHQKLYYKVISISGVE